jgi:hypothetical protein
MTVIRLRANNVGQPHRLCFSGDFLPPDCCECLGAPWRWQKTTAEERAAFAKFAASRPRSPDSLPVWSVDAGDGAQAQPPV